MGYEGIKERRGDLNPMTAQDRKIVFQVVPDFLTTSAQGWAEYFERFPVRESGVEGGAFFPAECNAQNIGAEAIREVVSISKQKTFCCVSFAASSRRSRSVATRV